jgi:hypothetical protein
MRQVGHVLRRVLTGYVTSYNRPMAVKRRKPEEQRRTVYLRVRLTAEQEALIKEAAAIAGITVSAWAVERLIRAARTEKRAEQR